MPHPLPGLLLDIDGVLTSGSEPVDGAPAALRALRAAGHPLRLVTNTTSRSRAVLARQLRDGGFDIDDDEILNPMVAASRWLREQEREPAALFVPETAREDFRGVEQSEEDVRAVVIGDLREAWTYDTMNRILRLLLEAPDRTLVALGGTRYWRARDGWRLDVGPFAAAFEMATSRPAKILGKPAADFFHLGCSAVDRAPPNVVMVGDDIRSDVGGALEAGLRAIQVRTGKFRAADLDEPIDPTTVLDSIADLPTFLAENQGL
ncbi:MAG TPA: TIGR01458 family HAD-type hydrolase [Candidatus Krumholzibacteria bacterium]|nr:TIGR01458 family HAD-type hydrolase [Candidatus Krumholzibacteria bacterium]